MKVITDSILVESKTARENQLEQIEQEQADKILNKIKSLYFALWNGKGISTTEAIAAFYQVEASTVRQVLNRHREELRSDGVENLRGKALKDVRDTLSLTSRQSNITVWTPRAALRLGMLLRDSSIAISVRTSLLDIAEKVPPATNNQIQSPLMLPSPREQLETVELGLSLLDKLGGCDERTQIQLKDRIRNILLEDRLMPSPKAIASEPKRLEYPVSDHAVPRLWRDRAITLGYKLSNSQLQQIGKKAVRLYQDKHGFKPPQREQFVGGATRMVNVYGHEDLEILDRAILSIIDPELRTLC